MRKFLLAATILGLPYGAYAQGSNNFQSLPNTTDLSALAATMNTNAQRSDEYGGRNITLYPGMITPGTGASITVGGNTFTLLYGSPDTFPNDWTGQIAINGSIMSGGDYTAAMALINGQLYIEDSKGHGWLVYDQSSGSFSPTADPGTGGSGATGSGATSNPPATAVSAAMAMPSPTTANQSCLASGAITPGSGSFTDSGGNTYSIDSGNGDVASINGAPVNSGSYRTAQLLQTPDGNIYGQDENTFQWFQLVNSGAVWQPLTSLPTGGQGPAPTDRWTTAVAGPCPTVGAQNPASGTLPNLLKICSDPATLSNELNASLCAQAFQGQAQLDQISAQLSASTQPPPTTTGSGSQ